MKNITAKAGPRLETTSGKNSKLKIKKETKPLVSVVMPVYNAAAYLSQAVDSILNQTYKNFEFIIIDDASRDGSYAILKDYAKKNKKIKIFRNKKNSGVSEAAKKAISKTKGEYLARMDADDISLPYRIEKQVAYLEKNKGTVALGGQCALIDTDGSVIGSKTFPTKFEDIYKYIFEFIPLQQPSVMIAKKRLPKNFEYYRNGMNTAEEVELIFKLFLYGKVENLKDTILKYRLHGKNTSLIDVKKTFFLTLLSRLKAVLYYNYKPGFSGIAITLLELLVVSVLPSRAVLVIYKILRTFNTYKNSFTFDIFPLKSITSKLALPKYE